MTEDESLTTEELADHVIELQREIYAARKANTLAIVNLQQNQDYMRQILHDNEEEIRNIKEAGLAQISELRQEYSRYQRQFQAELGELREAWSKLSNS